MIDLRLWKSLQELFIGLVECLLRMNEYTMEEKRSVIKILSTKTEAQQESKIWQELTETMRVMSG